MTLYMPTVQVDEALAQDPALVVISVCEFLGGHRARLTDLTVLTGLPRGFDPRLQMTTAFGHRFQRSGERS
jgi:hypothetical protein